MNLFDPISVSTTHQKALQIEKQLGRRSGDGLLTNIGSSTGGASRATSNSGPGQCAPLTGTPTNRTSTSGVRCFGYGETNHCQVDCKNQGKKSLFVDPNDYEEEDAYVGEEPVFDGTYEGDEEVLEGDTGPTLVVRWMCLTPRTNEDE